MNIHFNKKIVLGFSKREKIQKVFLQKMVPHSLSFFSVTVTRETSERVYCDSQFQVTAHPGREVTVAETPGIWHIASCQEAGKDRQAYTQYMAHICSQLRC